MNSQPSYSIHPLPITIPGHEAVSFIYLVRAERLALVDTGPASTLPQVTAQLAEFKIRPEEIDYILGTHIHLDHLGGLSQALELMPRARVIVHPRGLPHLVDPRKLWQASLEMSGETARAYGEPRPVPPAKLTAAEDGRMLDLGSLPLQVLFTPGHAPHHLSYWEASQRALLAGESAGIYFPDSPVIRPAAPPPFDPEQSLRSLEKMAALGPQTIYYCHYGVSYQAAAQLEAFRRGLALWRETLDTFFQPDRELTPELTDTILDTLITRDGTKPRFDSFSPERKDSELYFLRNNIRGYWEYYRRRSTA